MIERAGGVRRVREDVVAAKRMFGATGSPRGGMMVERGAMRVREVVNGPSEHAE